MPPAKVLIIADNVDSAVVWEGVLHRQGVGTTHLRYGAQTHNLSLPEHFDLVLIDSHTESEAALVVCRVVRSMTDMPILLVTPDRFEPYQIQAYEAGADECIVSPLSPLLFAAKMRVWLQQVDVTDYVSEDEISEAGFYLDPKTRQVYTRDGRTVKLTAQETRLLYLFLTNPSRVLDADFLLSQVWSQDTYGDKKVLINLVYRLRQKIASPSSSTTYIHHIAGEGYMWEPRQATD